MTSTAPAASEPQVVPSDYGWCSWCKERETQQALRYYEPAAKTFLERPLCPPCIVSYRSTLPSVGPKTATETSKPAAETPTDAPRLSTRPFTVGAKPAPRKRRRVRQPVGSERTPRKKKRADSAAAARREHVRKARAATAASS